MRRLARALVVGFVATALLPGAAHAATTATHITKQTPTSGPVASVIHIEGNGCADGGTFEVSNGSGVQFEFTSGPDGTFAFDYTVPPAEAGDQSEDSVYDTDLFCRSTNRHIKGSRFEITGPTYTLKPASAPAGATVRVVGKGCVQDGSGADDAVLLVDGKDVRTFKANGEFGFDFTFTVPALTPDRKYIVQINCLIQRLESAAGDGGQRFIAPALLLVTSAPLATTPTTAKASAGGKAGSSKAPLFAALAALIALVALVVMVRRRQANVRAMEDIEPAVAEAAQKEAAARDAAKREEKQRKAAERAEREAAAAAAKEAEREAREAAALAAAEQAQREADEQAAREAAQREAAEQAAREAAQREADEQAAREAAERAQREAEEQAAREEAERLEREAAEEAEREAAELAAREEAERLEREEAERLEREEAERLQREAEEQAAREEAERLEREEAERVAAEDAAREEAERLEREAAEREAFARAQREAREAAQAAEREAEEAERAAEERAAREAAEAAEAAEREALDRLEQEAREEDEREAAEQAEREAAVLAEEQAHDAAASARPRRRQPLKARRFAPVRLQNGDVTFPEPPYAEPRPHELAAFGDVRLDPYYWLRERDNPEVIEYLEAENAYTESVLEPLAGLRQTLFETIKGRTKEDDTSPPVPLRDWEYYVRTAEGAQYPDSCRRLRGQAVEETVILDRNAMAEGHDYLSCVGPSISPNDNLGLYATDFDGSEKYTIRVRNLETLEDLPDEIPDTSGNMAWVTDDVFVYVMLDEAHRPYQVRRHVLGDDASDDPVIYEDNDERFFVRVVRDIAGRFVFVQSGSKISNENHFLHVEDPLGPLTIVEPRVDGLEYETCDDGERFLILTNADGAVDFKVVAASVDNPGRARWIDVLPHREGTRVTEVAAFKTFTAIGERGDALTTIRIIDKATGAQHVMRHNEAVYSAEIDVNAEFDTTKLRFTFTSLNTPMTWIDYDVTTRKPKLVKRLEVLGDFNPSDYVTAREWATADDGTRIPISIVCRRDFDPDGTSPCLLYGYGSYEISIDPYFSIPRLNLVDRGVVFAIAHIRGGGEMGRNWYENGKMRNKRNTFTDFVACARHLIDNGWSAPDKLVARGGSAGGLLMGAVANMAPQLFNTIVAEVPFVDVVTTMSDETIPLTVTEWEEWGNPRDNADDYHYMKSYSPYDNVDEMDYPALYVEAGLNDPRVQYWEPAKWVAKLRVTKTDDNPLVLKTEMGAGHSGPSGRYSAWEDEARVQAFILDRLSIDY